MKKSKKAKARIIRLGKPASSGKSLPATSSASSSAVGRTLAASLNVSLEDLVLEVVSVLYEPVTPGQIQECLDVVAGSARVRGGPDSGEVAKALQALREKGSVVARKGNKVECGAEVVESAARRSVREGRFGTLARAAQRTLPGWDVWGLVYNCPYERALRDFRIAFYEGKGSDIERILREIHRKYPDKAMEDLFLRFIGRPVDLEWVATLAPGLRVFVVEYLLSRTLLNLEADESYPVLLKPYLGWGTRGFNSMYHDCLFMYRLLQGRWSEAEALAGEHEHPLSLCERAALAFVRGENERALDLYEKAACGVEGSSKRKLFCFGYLCGFFYVLALLKSRRSDDYEKATNYLTGLKRNKENALEPVAQAFLTTISHIRGELSKEKRSFISLHDFAGDRGLFDFLRLLAYCWLELHPAPREIVDSIVSLMKRAERSGFRWLARESAEMLARLKQDTPESRARAKELGGEFNAPSILEVVPNVAPWERSLEALRMLGEGRSEGKDDKDGPEERLVWRIEHREGGRHCAVEPAIQKRTATGKWSGGRPVAVSRLMKESDSLACLSARDKEIIGAAGQVAQYSRRYYSGGQTSYSIDWDRALPLLVGHPLCFWSNEPSVRVELVAGEPELRVLDRGGAIEIDLVPRPWDDGRVAVMKETPTRLRVVRFTAEHKRIHTILGDRPLAMPAEGRERVLRSLGAVAPLVAVHSDIGGGTVEAESVAADSRTLFQIRPYGAGLKAHALVRPLGSGGPMLRPGAGGETVIADVEGKRLQTRRDLAEEKRRFAAFLDRCPVVNRVVPLDGEWSFEQSEDCLELMEQLEGVREDVVLEWPEGETLRAPFPASFANLSLGVRRDRDWFALDGTLRVDETLVLTLRQLLDLVGQTSGRFLPLGDGKFLAITEEFRRRLEEARAYSEPVGKGARIHPLASLALEDFLGQVENLETDPEWKKTLDRLSDTRGVDFNVPSTLRAELRDYQTEGFVWLSRLAHWGVGACLADDMGLGKTVEALALLLARAAGGPALVVAPTSVVPNWEAEARRFAPTLKVKVFGAGSRAAMIESLGPFDLLLCSYGLLHQEAERLSQPEWETVILDEAQAIKNMTTKRSQAAMSLGAKFRLITTGTPIENHLGELWNLFRFINPGLLGSIEQFNDRFAGPIERWQDKQARLRLKKLIQPFILRRTKHQVLDELPPRTEITRLVELSREEMAFYEALRRDAVDRLADLAGGGKGQGALAGQARIRILAEIMRLRRACCHPRLVAPQIQLPGAKLAEFDEILDELIENRHKALVFSQFVDHLAILRSHLDEKDVAYQYLDGSTPTRERKRSVDAFQNGEGDLFLISLRAGGLGLNLTAADFVIHMDPWWNPAVEDQASDRAHRMGQQRPVTIYRLVAKGTIEQQIVDLHRHKRDLADSLLEGSDMAGKVSSEDLLRLLRGEALDRVEAPPL